MNKGRYVALVAVDIHIEEQDGLRPFEEMKDDLMNGTVTNELCKSLEENFSADEGDADVKVTQWYADLYEVNEEE